jgi:hypothetical protein
MSLLIIVFSILAWLWPFARAFHGGIIHLDPYAGRSLGLIHIHLIISAAFGLLVFFINGWMWLYRDDRTKLSDVRWRIGWLNLLMPAGLFLLHDHPTLVGNLVIFGVPLVFAWAIFPLIDVCGADDCPRHAVLRDMGMVFIGFTLLHGWSGVYFTKAIGEHSGDEGHYILQAHSLYHDGDIDLRNNLPNTAPEQRSRVHISENSRGNAWYSWHPPGLSFLLALTTPGGMYGRHLLLAMISGLGLAGCYGLARKIGAYRKNAWVVVVVFGAGLFWGTYASRALPETLGATLVTWFFLLILWQRHHPWKATVMAAGCAWFLPWVQTRFVPPALVLMACFTIHGLLDAKPRGQNAMRLTFFGLLSLCGLLLYLYGQRRLFVDGLGYPVPRLLFSLPVGLWHSLASDRGILLALPVFSLALAAMVWSIRGRLSRWPALYGTFLFLSVWLTSCSTTWFAGGICMPGRFLLVVSPVAMAFLALALNDANRGLRAWSLYLGLFPAVFFVHVLVVLPALGKSFTNPYNVELVHPLLSGLIRLFYNPYAVTSLLPALLLYLAGLFLLIFKRLPGIGQCFFLVAMVAGIWICRQPSSEPDAEAESRHHPRRIATILEQIYLTKFFVTVGGDVPDTQPLFAFSDRFKDFNPPWQIRSVTSKDLGALSVGHVISAPRVPENDWSGRGYRWATMVPPFPAREGRRAVYIEASLTGSAEATLVIREGAVLHAEKHVAAGGSIRECIVFDVRNRGDVYILVRLQGGDGDFVTERIACTLFTDKLIKTARLSVP